MTKKSAGIELAQARLEQLNKKAQEYWDTSLKTKEQYEELKGIMGSMQEAGISDGLESIQNKMQQRIKENTKAVEEFNKLKVRIEEVKELVEILGGGKD